MRLPAGLLLERGAGFPVGPGAVNDDVKHRHGPGFYVRGAGTTVLPAPASAALPAPASAAAGPPRMSDAAAATRPATMAKANAACRLATGPGGRPGSDPVRSA